MLPEKKKYTDVGTHARIYMTVNVFGHMIHTQTHTHPHSLMAAKSSTKITTPSILEPRSSTAFKCDHCF